MNKSPLQSQKTLQEEIPRSLSQPWTDPTSKAEKICTG